MSQLTKSWELSGPALVILTEVNDAGLLARARRGDQDAFSRLFARYQGPIYRYAAHMCGADAADDVVQDTFLAVLRQSERYDPTRGLVGPYLFGIARHLMLKRLTRGDVVFAEPLGDEVDCATAADELTALDALTREESIEAVRTAVQSLPRAYREAIVLCEFQEMEYAAAAEIMCCPIGTVRSRLHRARTLLTSKLAATQPVRMNGRRD